jgi:hypothetical protein
MHFQLLALNVLSFRIDMDNPLGEAIYRSQKSFFERREYCAQGPQDDRVREKNTQWVCVWMEMHEERNV